VLRDVKNREAYPHTFKLGFVMPPLDPRFDRQLYQAGLQDPIMVNPKTDNMDESLKFLKWVYTEGIEHFIPGGRLPADVNYPAERAAELFVAGYEDLIDKDSFERVFDSTRNVTVIYMGLDEAGTILQQEAESAIVGTKTPEQALADAKARADEYLKNR